MALVNHTFLFLACAVFVLSLSDGQLRPRQYVLCECSPTKRGYRKEVREELEIKMKELGVKIGEFERDRKSREKMTEDIVEITTELWSDCIRDYSTEECANADASLRTSCGESRCPSYCEYDSGTWDNWNPEGEAAPGCDSDDKWASEHPAITSGKFDPELVNRSAVNPRPAPAGSPPRVRKRPAENPGAAISSISEGADAGVLPPRKPVSSKAGNVSMDSEGVGGNSTDGEVLTATMEPELTTGIPSLGERRPLNEGCVAVEHLQGYVLQHRRHMLRTVLCAEGFCATPNHALIVDGKWTSMRHLCKDEWQCVRTKKLVNNLKIFANRRVAVSQRITVTPYDARFPRLAIWAVQIAEDCVYLVVYSLVLAVLVAIFVLLGAAVKDL